uniref:VIT domain-containing protein n=1 Tax=Timema bartmani TaxID=61472 RepID=A0A7R9I4Z4_9NEOP|nr:unnamed protein product [Timema bartmani]
MMRVSTVVAIVAAAFFLVGVVQSQNDALVASLEPTVDGNEKGGFARRKDVKPDMYSLHIVSNIQYRYATTVVTSRVANRANTSQEVIFTVVLPETAFISGFLM